MSLIPIELFDHGWLRMHSKEQAEEVHLANRVVARLVTTDYLRQIGREGQQDSFSVEMMGLPIHMGDKVIGKVTGAWVEGQWIVAMMEFDEEVRVG
jgi:hypothetical protein